MPDQPWRQTHFLKSGLVRDALGFAGIGNEFAFASERRRSARTIHRQLPAHRRLATACLADLAMACLAALRESPKPSLGISIDLLVHDNAQLTTTGSL